MVKMQPEEHAAEDLLIFSLSIFKIKFNYPILPHKTKNMSRKMFDIGYNIC